MPNRADRNLAIERLLREGHGAPSGPAQGACVTAEELAAWVDGGLVAADAARVEAHLASCLACQALLGAFASTEAVSQTGPSRRLTRALLPLAAAAVLVVGVWLVGTRRDSPSAPAVTQLARVREAPPAPPPPPGTTSAARAEAPQRADREAARRPEIRLDRSTARSEPSASAPAAFGEAARERENSAVAGLGQAKAAAAPPAVSPAAAVPAPAPAQAAADVAANSRLAEVSARQVEARLPVASPDGASRWRIVGSVLETSEDGGATWLPAAGATPAQLADVTGGASPARGVSWLVGRGGLVLVTADGRRFTRTSAPAPALLVGVEAVDGAIAEVRASDGRRWRTTNAGRTWMPVP